MWGISRTENHGTCVFKNRVVIFTFESIRTQTRINYKMHVQCSSLCSLETSSKQGLTHLTPKTNNLDRTGFTDVSQLTLSQSGLSLLKHGLLMKSAKAFARLYTKKGRKMQQIQTFQRYVTTRLTRWVSCGC